MPSVRTSQPLRATVLFLLALVCGTCALSPPPGANPSRPSPQLQQLQQPQQPRLQQAAPVAPVAAYESGHAGGGEADVPRGSVLHGDRRRAAPAPTGAPGAQPLVTRTATPFADPVAGRTGGPDSRPRPLAAHDPSALQVFLC